jgi:hypothetical protein
MAGEIIIGFDGGDGAAKEALTRLEAAGVHADVELVHQSRRPVLVVPGSEPAKASAHSVQ